MDNDESHLNVSVIDCESEIHKTASVIHYMYVYIGPWGIELTLSAHQPDYALPLGQTGSRPVDR